MYGGLVKLWMDDFSGVEQLGMTRCCFRGNQTVVGSVAMITPTFVSERIHCVCVWLGYALDVSDRLERGNEDGVNVTKQRQVNK